jgi:hypothetical protein
MRTSFQADHRRFDAGQEVYFNGKSCVEWKVWKDIGDSWLLVDRFFASPRRTRSEIIALAEKR